MTEQPTKAERFLALQRSGSPLLMPNPWDVGSARLLESLGFAALATTSSGSAAALGRLDGSLSREEALAHAATLVEAVDVPVSADLENGFGDATEEVVRTVEMALAAGLAGCSIEDYSGGSDTIYELDAAVERVAAAAEVAHRGDVHLVLTARAENHLHGRPDLDDTITRLQRYQEAGADVLFAPGVVSADDIRRLVISVDRPVSVLLGAGAPGVAELAELGVSRVSTGGSFAFAAYGALVEAATELRDQGTNGYLQRTRTGLSAARKAFRR